MKQTTFDEFVDLARRGTFVPVVREIMADLLTPVSAFLNARVLARGRCGVVDAHHLGDVAVQRRRGPRAHLLGDREKQVAAHRHHALGRPLARRVEHGLGRRQQRGDAGLVVEVARDDEARVGELGLGIDRDVIADVDPQGLQIGLGVAELVDAQLHLGPCDGLRVDLFVERVARGLQRQDRAAPRALVGEERGASALGKAAGPAADRHDLAAAVGLQGLHHRAERVEVRNDRAVELRIFALDRGPDRTAPGDLEGNPESLELLAGPVHDLVGIAGGAGQLEHLQHHPLQVLRVDRQLLHAPRTRAALVCGNNRSTNRSAVGCGSWLASPGRSLASMKA